MPYLTTIRATALKNLIHVLQTEGMVDLIYDEFNWKLNNIDIDHLEQLERDGEPIDNLQYEKLAPLGIDSEIEKKRQADIKHKLEEDRKEEERLMEVKKDHGKDKEIHIAHKKRMEKKHKGFLGMCRSFSSNT